MDTLRGDSSLVGNKGTEVFASGLFLFDVVKLGNQIVQGFFYSHADEELLSFSDVVPVHKVVVPVTDGAELLLTKIREAFFSVELDKSLDNCVSSQIIAKPSPDDCDENSSWTS